jgi:hypothetical protein
MNLVSVEYLIMSIKLGNFAASLLHGLQKDHSLDIFPLPEG